MIRKLMGILNPCKLFQTKSGEDIDPNSVNVTQWVKEGINGDSNGSNEKQKSRRQSISSCTVTVDVSISTENSSLDKDLTPGRRYLGLFLALLASIFCSLTVFIAKVLAARYHPLNLGFWKFQGVWIPSLIVILYKYFVMKKLTIFETILPLNCPTKRKTQFLLVLRALMGCSAILLQFYSLIFISVADSSVIRFSTPILVTIVAFFVLHEAFSIVQILMAVTSMLGVLILARPPFLTGRDGFDMENLLGAGLAFGSMACTTVVFVCLRFLRGTNSLLVILVFGIWGSLQCLVLSLSIGQFQMPSGLYDWTLGIMLALLTFLGQLFITLAMKHEQSGVVSLVRCLDVVFTFIYQFIFLGISPDLFSVLGALLVVLSVGMIGTRKWISELPQDNSWRDKFWFLLK